MTKIVCRLLDAADEMLGWAEVQAITRGDGLLRAPRNPVVVPIDVTGVTACVSLHWCDLNVEVRIPIASTPVTVGAMFLIFEAYAEMIRVGTPPTRLAVTSTRQHMEIHVPVGGLGAWSNA